MIRRRPRPLLVLALLLAPPLSSPAGTPEGRVVFIADIDAPERRQPWGKRAKQALGELAAGETMRVEVLTTDRYGREIGRVHARGIQVNRALVRDGHAWVYTKYNRDPELPALES
jgi:endonuclease YncB( thermonuclease family)